MITGREEDKIMRIHMRNACVTQQRKAKQEITQYEDQKGVGAFPFLYGRVFQPPRERYSTSMWSAYIDRSLSVVD